MIKKADTIEAIASDLVALMNHLRTKNIDAMNQSSWMALNLTMPQVRVLFTVLRGGKLTSSGIAETLGTSPSAVTPLVDKLIEAKLVKREPDVDDRRVSWIVPTAAANQLQEKLMGANRHSVKELLDALDADQLAEVKRGLSVLVAATKRQA